MQEVGNHNMSPYGLLEIKVVCKQGVQSLKDVDYLKQNPNTKEFFLDQRHNYFYQVQCQLALTGIDWCDFFSYITDDMYFCQRIKFDPDFFQDCKDRVDQYYFDYYLISKIFYK